MRPLIGVNELRGVDVRVALRGAQPRVTEQLLDRAEISAALEEVRRERMAQRVRADAVAFGDHSVPTHQAVDAPDGEAPASIVQEERFACGPRGASTQIART